MAVASLVLSLMKDGMVTGQEFANAARKHRGRDD